MVGIAEKPVTARRAVASASVRMQRSTLTLLAQGATSKGDVLATARIAGIQAAKRTWELIPLCHPIALTGVAIEIRSEAREGADLAPCASRQRSTRSIEPASKWKRSSPRAPPP